MSFKFKILVVLALIGLMGLAGCVPAAPGAPAAAPTAAPAAAEPTAAPAASSENKPLNIAVIVKSVTSDYWKTVGAGVEAAMKADPTIKASFLGPNEETDIEGQIRIIESQISAGVDALAVAPSQADQVQPTLEKAVAAGIPVILVDTDLANFSNKSAFVGTDNKLGGQLGGEFIAKALKAGDEVAIIRGAAGDPVHNLREQGAKEAMEKAGLKVIAIQPADSDRAKGQTVAENLLTANPNLKGVFATNDEMALGAANAAKSAGKTLVIVGFDATNDALKAIEDGSMSGSVAQFPTKIGELGTLTAAKVARGEKVDAFVNTGVEVVSKDNLDKFMKPAASSENKPLNIAVIVKSVTSDYWKTVGAGVEAAMKADPSIKASFLGPNEETDIEGQIRIIESQISAKVDALAVAPSQADQVQPTLEKAVAAGIPVILVDTDLANFSNKSAFVGTDNKLGGQLGGEFIVMALKAGDEVAIIRGAAGDPVHNLREQGAKEAMEKAGLKVVAIQPADSDRAKGQTVAENLLTANPNLKGIFATNDEMALGAANAAKSAGKTLVIVGFDATNDALKAIEDGSMSGSVAQFPTKIGELGTLTAAKVARGEKVDAFVNTGVEVVSKDNLDQFMK
jgi:ribose transport system substrate-binding protein